MKKFNNESVTLVDVMRHGECQGGEIYRGSTDVALTDRGWQQMEEAVAHALPAPPWQRVITSPLVRCHDFAAHLSKRYDLPLTVEPDLREMNFGHWEGRLVEEVHREHAAEVASFYKDPSQVTPPNGEPVVDVQRRVANAFWRYLDSHQNQRLLFVQHGVTIRALVVSLLGLPLSQLGGFEIPYAGRLQFKVYTSAERRRVVLCRLG
ncbi:histidine phosphatase family protein [Halioxenophilus aromaticivorans]|uniref:Alpha-ribazole phosphatase family protein n=1 Tax=Halioxenophilus aromaticivorans TaxID=1306992 RepID=A0AAV3U7G6_9ALTE